MEYEIRRLTDAEGWKSVGALADVLVDCVEGGASVSFMAPFSKTDAEAFFEQVMRDVENGDCILLAAYARGKLVGTVQVAFPWPPNQRHRADVAKLLVARSFRGQGIAKLLMQQAEVHARAAGKSLLVLDTATGDAAEKLYEGLGWKKVGIIPKYALYPDGRWCDTTVFYKNL